MSRVRPSISTIVMLTGDGSVTGLASIVEGLHAKLVGLAHDVFPGLNRLGLLINPAGANQVMFAEQVGAAANARGVTVLREEARMPSELASAFDGMAKTGAQIVMIAPNGMFINQRKTIIRLALETRLPTMFEQRQDVEAGGFMSYGVNETEGSQRAAAFVDKILKGAKPSDLPIEFPTKIEMVINLKTAKQIGIEVPLHLQQLADEVIE
jgi:ABC-type uncharacterized transport system substrate-binding protein